MCYVVALRNMHTVTQRPDIPGYSGFYPRINGYIVNCTRFCTKVARNFVLRCSDIQSRDGLEMLL